MCFDKEIKKSWFLQHATEVTLQKLRNQVISLRFFFLKQLNGSKCVLYDIRPYNSEAM